MATKLTDLTELAAKPADGDFLHIVDVDDSTGGAAGTSKKITIARLGIESPKLIQVERTVTNAEVLTMKYDNAPITLVAASIGMIHVPVGVTFVATWGSPNENSSDDMRVGWDAQTSTTADYFNGIRDFMNGISSGTHTISCTPFASGFGNAYPGSPVNKPLQAWCSDVFTGGWSMTIYTTYYSITV
jgi:hypothetical protein